MSTLKADTIQSTSGGAATLTKQHAPKGWVNFNGSGTLAVRDSFNVSSVTDNGSGDFTPNFNTAFSDTNYIGLGANEGEVNHSRGMGGIGVMIDGSANIQSQTTTALRMAANYNASASSDGGARNTLVGFAAFLGDLA